jgi:dienelactone hydrolase
MAVERVLYHAGGKRFIGALVYDERITARRPPLLMAGNWLGTAEEAINRPQMMATSHFIDLVADMYGDGRVSAGPPEAAQLADASRGDPNERRQRIVAVLTAFVKESGKSGTGGLSRKATVGFCFRGGNALELPAPAPTCVARGTHAVDSVSPKAQRDAFESAM